MVLLWLVLLAVWTILFFRLLCARATFSDRTLATYLVLGAFLGFSIAPFVQKLLDPYGDGGPLAAEMVALGRQAALLIPVAAALFPKRRFAATSVADDFLLAFAAGFGFDLAGALLTAVNATGPLRGLSFFPPFQFDAPDFSVAGYGIWSGLIALAIAAMMRFVRKPRLTLVVAIVVYLFVATEQAALFGRYPADTLLASFGKITLHGQATAWIAMVALIALSLLESRWMAQSGVTKAGEFQLLHDLQESGGLLLRARFREYVCESRKIGLRRQEQMVRGELAHSPGDAALGRILARIEAAQRNAEANEAGSAPASAAGLGARPPIWWNPIVKFSAPWVALVLIVFLLPLLPASVGTFFWSQSSVVNFQWGSLPSLLNLAILAILLRSFVVSADRPDRPGEADDRLQFRAEQAILRTALGAILLVVLYGTVENLYSALPSTVAFFSRVGLPRYDHLQVTTLWLLFALAATTLTEARSMRWQKASAPERRRSAVHNALMAAGGFFVGWICVSIYTPAIKLAHQTLGAALFNTFGGHGNYAAAELTALVLAALGFGVALFWSWWSRRAERFMAGK